MQEQPSGQISLQKPVLFPPTELNRIIIRISLAPSRQPSPSDFAGFPPSPPLQDFIIIIILHSLPPITNTSPT